MEIINVMSLLNRIGNAIYFTFHLKKMLFNSLLQDYGNVKSMCLVFFFFFLGFSKWKGEKNVDR